MVGRPAHARRVFLEPAQARQRLARVEQRGAGPRDGIDIGPRHGRDAGEMLHRVEGGTLGGEQGACAAAQPHQVGARHHAIAILDQPLDLDLGIECAEKGLGNGQAGDGDRVAAVHHPGKHRIGRDHRGGGDVAFVAEILGERGGNKGIEIESRKCEDV